MELKREIERDFIAPDGLMALSYMGFRRPYGSAALPTANNDNGILFLVYYYLVLDSYDFLEDKDKERFENTVRALRRDKINGLYNRNPERNHTPEAHDNRLAIAVGSTLFGSPFADHLVSYGRLTGYIYDNVNIEPIDQKRFTQPSDIAAYKICAGITPHHIEFAWLLVGIIITFFMPQRKSSEILLTWMRLKGCLKALKNKVKKSQLDDVFYLCLLITRGVWGLVRPPISRNLKHFFTEKDGHKIRELAKDVGF